MNEQFQEVAAFHGHVCPGLAIGYRVGAYVKKHYASARDEELVAVVENNSCSVDAIQYMLGCTFGKGNLVFKDYGKQVFTFYSREAGTALRIYFKGEILQGLQEPASQQIPGAGDQQIERRSRIRREVTGAILQADDSELFEVTRPDIPEPARALVRPSIRCELCGELFMETKGRIADGKVVCRPCFEDMLR